MEASGLCLGMRELGSLRKPELSTTGLQHLLARETPLLSAALWDGTHTYIKYEGRGRCEALDTDVGQHFKHVAFPTRHVDEPERTIQGTERILLRSPARPSSGRVLSAWGWRVSTREG